MAPHLRGNHYTLGSNITYGTNVTIWQGATICDGANLGNHCVIGSNVWIGKDVTIGAHTRIQHGAFIPNGTKIGAYVFIGPNVTLTDDKYPRVGNLTYNALPPVLKDYCSIGAGAVILPGVEIGEKAMVGAGAVVAQAVRPFSTVVGVPARELAHNLEEYYETA